MWRVLFAVLSFVVILEIPIAFAESQQCDAGIAKSSTVSVSNPVNINTATAEMLSTQLKGIGKAKAAAIIEWRETNGNFSSLEDLDEVKGIGAGIIEKKRQNRFYRLTIRVFKHAKWVMMTSPIILIRLSHCSKFRHHVF